MRKIYFLLVILCAAFVLHGCAPRDKPYSKTEADKSFLKITQDELNAKAHLFWAQDTLWIYLPDENRELYKVAIGPKSSPAPKKKFTLEYVDGTFKDKTFTFEYDVINATKIASGSGLATQYTEEFNAQYRNIITAISRVYFSAEKPPEFIVLVLADVKKGVEIQSTLHLLDLKKYCASTLAPDEYSLRVLSEPQGDKKIVGDFEGRHLKPTAVSWPYFLNKQIAQRIRYKFQNSDFPPEETPKTEILKIIAATMMIYDFKDYEAVVLSDLRNQKAEHFTRSQIEALQDKSMLGSEKPVPEGKIITIDFSDLGLEKELPADGGEKDLINATSPETSQNFLGK